MMESTEDYVFVKMIVFDGRTVREIQLAAKRFPVLNGMCLERLWYRVYRVGESLLTWGGFTEIFTSVP